MASDDRRSAWRLRVRLPRLDPARDPELFAWLREYVVPACLHAPVRVTLELVPPDDDP